MVVTGPVVKETVTHSSEVITGEVTKVAYCHYVISGSSNDNVEKGLEKVVIMLTFLDALPAAEAALIAAKMVLWQRW